jgi:uncharacterized protein YuzE
VQHDVYVYLAARDTAVSRTREVVLDGAHTPVNVDLDVEGNVIGVEILSAHSVEINGRPALIPLTLDPARQCEACGVRLEDNRCWWCDGE